jgi:hypothetical protein
MQTKAQIEIAKALAACRFLPASWDKRFARDMAAMATNRPDRDFTDRQLAHLLRLAHKYRRQISASVLETALDEMERQANPRVASGSPALPDFAPRRRRKPAAPTAALPSLPLFER